MPEKVVTKRKKDIQPKEPTETEQSVFDSIMAIVEGIPEIKSGKRKAKLSIEQDQIIGGLGYCLAYKTKQWLKFPSGWPDMDFTIAKNGQREGFILEFTNIGTDAGIAHRKSGFLLIAHPIGKVINVQTIYLPEDNKFREPRFDMQNPYWQEQHAFMEAVNRTGIEFVDQLDQEPTINKLKFAQRMVEQAVHLRTPER